jgi:HEAT repeat protein
VDVDRSNASLPNEDVFLRPNAAQQPTPDYGTLGPCPDVACTPIAESAGNQGLFSTRAMLQLSAAVAGIAAALLVSSVGGRGASWGKLSGTSAPRKTAIAVSDSELNHEKPQKQAEILLERAVTHSNGASNEVAEQIQSRADSWRGALKWDNQLADLTTAALNSNDRNVQSSAVEVQLAAYGVAKRESSVDALLHQADSRDHSQKVWALWTLGLLANRGIETDRIVQELVAHLRDSDRAPDANSEDARRWAVEGLALAGTARIVEPLLDAMHNDPSALVRERAACSLAQSGMLTHEQRLIAVPKLIDYSSDPALDVQTRAWAFQALGEITGQRIPNDSTAWRSWYQGNSGVN